MAVHPRTHDVYLSVMRGRGDAAVPVIVRIDVLDGSFGEVSVENVAFAAAPIDRRPAAEDDPRVTVELPDGPEGEEIEIGGRKLRIWRRPARTATVTDMSYVDGTLLVAGMSNEEFSSNLRRIPFPFTGDMDDNSLEIFHVVARQVGDGGADQDLRALRGRPQHPGQLHVHAGRALPAGRPGVGTKATGRTVAELGAMNQPLDMVSFPRTTTSTCSCPTAPTA